MDQFMDEERKSENINNIDLPVRFLHPAEMQQYNITLNDLLEDDYTFDGYCYRIKGGSKTEIILSLKGMKFDLIKKWNYDQNV